MRFRNSMISKSTEKPIKLGGLIFAKFETDVKNDIGKLKTQSNTSNDMNPLKEHKERI